MVDLNCATSEEVALSRFTERGYNGDGITIDRDLRQTLLDRDREDALKDPEPVLDETLIPVIDPSAITATITVDELRALIHLPPDPDPVTGAMKVAEFQAKAASATAPGSHPTDPDKNKPNGFDVNEPPDPETEPNADTSQNPNPASARGPSGTAKKKAPAK